MMRRKKNNTCAHFNAQYIQYIIYSIYSKRNILKIYILKGNYTVSIKFQIVNTF